mmetsp:Transcript_28413/g.66687  ORF Transcript_28413/g.66687 Transcript_28413/m.66687 type:complete len:108 (+) Transcript_28413:553-876(+)
MNSFSDSQLLSNNRCIITEYPICYGVSNILSTRLVRDDSNNTIQITHFGLLKENLMFPIILEGSVRQQFPFIATGAKRGKSQQTRCIQRGEELHQCPRLHFEPIERN